MAERMLSPLGRGWYRTGSSPPSPVFDRPPRRFMAIASVVCASHEIDPNDMAPEAKRFTIDSTGSTSSIGTGSGLVNSSRWRSVTGASAPPSMMRAYSR